MLATPHLLVGALIGQLTGNYFLAVIIGLASHFILDLIPHSDFSAFLKTDPELRTVSHVELAGAVIDILVGAILILGVVEPSEPIIAGAIAAILPDALDNIPLWNQWLRKQAWFRWFYRLHKSVDGSIHYESSGRSRRAFGVFTQLIIVGAAIWLLLS